MLDVNRILKLYFILSENKKRNYYYYYYYSRMAVHNLIKKIKETGSTDRRKGSCQSVTATTEENASIFEELVYSQEDEPGTHNPIKQMAPWISISKSSVHHLVKKKNLHFYKRLKTPQMN